MPADDDQHGDAEHHHGRAPTDMGWYEAGSRGRRPRPSPGGSRAVPAGWRRRRGGLDIDRPACYRGAAGPPGRTAQGRTVRRSRSVAARPGGSAGRVVGIEGRGQSERGHGCPDGGGQDAPPGSAGGGGGRPSIGGRRRRRRRPCRPGPPTVGPRRRTRASARSAPRPRARSGRPWCGPAGGRRRSGAGADPRPGHPGRGHQGGASDADPAPGRASRARRRGTRRCHCRQR